MENSEKLVQLLASRDALCYSLIEAKGKELVELELELKKIEFELELLGEKL